MKKTQINLKLVLNGLGITSEITTLEDRKRVQKAIYIGQEAGVDLGYSYGWYLLGPYSPELTKEYFTLNNEIKSGDEDYQSYQLVEPLSSILENIKSLIEVPHNVNLSQEDWLELVASIVYLMKEKNDKNDTENILCQEKSSLMNYFDDAFSLSEEHGLIINKK